MFILGCILWKSEPKIDVPTFELCVLIELRSTCPFPIVAVIIVYIFFAKILEWPFVVRFPHLFSGCCTGHCPGCGVINIYIFFKDFRVAICTMVFTSVSGLLLWPLCSVVFSLSRCSLSIRHSFSSLASACALTVYLCT